ncbi:MAG: MBL fold metallo-hydrolase [Lentisphaeria bacterium]|nr:MBL fold metallo-hydrolase [Candidatus Neomarinimicrobiota bacterium]MCF7841802.1 MBL fold metallo-hydrolase [Lentisphaeria bacterium]
MKIGAFEISEIITSEFGLDGGAMFGVVPKTLWSRQVGVDDQNRIDMVTRTLLLESADRKILVDTGNGDKWAEKYKSIYRIDWSRFSLVDGLAKKGISPSDITDVICTHLHFDHVGGNTRMENDKLVPVFPSATYWVQAANWELANSPTEKDQASYLSENWGVLAENGMVKILENEREFLDGIRFEIVNGHTTGQQLPIVSDGTTTLMYGGDLFPMKPHIPVPWVMAYDIEPMTTIAEKKRVLPKMVEEDWILFFEHDPNTAACKVVKTDKGYFGGDAVELDEGTR